MASNVCLLLFAILVIHCLIPRIYSESIIKLPSVKSVAGDRRVGTDNALYCDSWRFSVETNDAGIWRQIPSSCIEFVQDYMDGDRYSSDSDVVSSFSSSFASSVEISGDGKDAWVFDIDETVLSNLPYYKVRGFGSETFDEKSFDDWVSLAKAPALPASLHLYEQLCNLGFKIFLLTGRSEYQRNATEENLLFAGYRNWERLILRGPSDQGKPAVVYKSEKRLEIINQGYRIHGNSGDQWSDLLGYALATRSFKLPNPMYHIA